MNILIRAFYGTCNVLGAPTVIPTLDVIDSMLDHGKIDVWSIIPSIVDEIGETPSVLAKFKSAKVILASGGEIPFSGVIAAL